MVDDIPKKVQASKTRWKLGAKLTFMRCTLNNRRIQTQSGKRNKFYKKVNPFIQSREDLSIIRFHKHLKQKVKYIICFHYNRLQLVLSVCLQSRMSVRARALCFRVGQLDKSVYFMCHLLSLLCKHWASLLNAVLCTTATCYLYFF